MIVKISEADRAQLHLLARNRNESKHPEATRRKLDVMTDHTVDFIGLKGELACERVFGIHFDRSTRSSGDDGSDMELWPGFFAAIKYNHRTGGYLLFERLTDFETDVAISVYGNCDPPRRCVCGKERGDEFVTVSGWITRQRFLDCCREADWGIGHRWYVQQSVLNPIGELVRMVESSSSSSSSSSAGKSSAHSGSSSGK